MGHVCNPSIYKAEKGEAEFKVRLGSTVRALPEGRRSIVTISYLMEEYRFPQTPLPIAHTMAGGSGHSNTGRVEYYGFSHLK